MLYSQMGYYLTGVIYRSMAREEIKGRLLQTIPDNELTAINAQDNATAISWEEEGKEFSLNNRMYDVVRNKEVNGKKLLLCLDDEKESRLVEKMKTETGSQQQTPGKDGKMPVFKLVYDAVIIPDNTYQALVPASSHAFMSYDASLLQQAANITVPPPKA